MYVYIRMYIYIYIYKVYININIYIVPARRQAPDGPRQDLQRLQGRPHPGSVAQGETVVHMVPVIFSYGVSDSREGHWLVLRSSQSRAGRRGRAWRYRTGRVLGTERDAKGACLEEHPGSTAHAETACHTLPVILSFQRETFSPFRVRPRQDLHRLQGPPHPGVFVFFFITLEPRVE